MHEDPSFRLAIAKNVAENGRLFCQMLFLLCLVAFILGYGAWFARLAVFAALPVGSSCIFDQFPNGPIRFVGSLLIYSLAALVAILFLATIG